MPPAWGFYQNDSGDWVATRFARGLPENGQPEIGYGLLPEYEHQGYATEAVRAARRWAFEQPRRHRRRAKLPPIMLPRGMVLHRGLCSDRQWARKGRGLFYAKSLDSIAKSALSLYIARNLCQFISI